MKNKLFFLCFSLAFVHIYADVQDLTTDVIVGLKENVETNVRMLNDLQQSIFGYVIDSANENNDCQEIISELKKTGLSRIFIFDEKHIMYKEISYENGIFSSKLLNHNHVALRKTQSDKMYLSPFFAYKNKCYYFLGIKNAQNTALFLIRIPEFAKQYCLIDYNGVILVNTLKMNKETVTSNINIIKGEDENARLKLIKSNGFKLFLPSNQYYLFY